MENDAGLDVDALAASIRGDVDTASDLEALLVVAEARLVPRERWYVRGPLRVVFDAASRERRDADRALVAALRALTQRVRALESRARQSG